MVASPHALERFVRRLGQRSPLSDDERATILALPNRPQQVQRRQVIIAPGETTDESCLVVEGLIARFDQMHAGQRQIVSFYLPGDMCDLQSVAVRRAGWGLEAMTISTVLFIPHKSLAEAAIKHMPVAMAFWRDTIADASILAKWVGNLGRRQAAARLAHLLCELGTRMEDSAIGSRTKYRLPLSQEQIADAIGLTSVHVNRTLKGLKAEGITVRGGDVRIEDWDRLVRLADFDPAYLLLSSGRPVARG